MKRKTLAIMATILPLLLSTNIAIACGACGCSLSNYNPELLISAGNHSLGIFNQTRWFSTRLSNHSIDLAGTSSMYYQIQSLTELRGSWYVHNRVSVTGILPFSRRVLQRESETLEQHTGLGDAIVSMNVIALRNGKRIEAKKFMQQLSFGGGIKLPTGSFNKIGYEDEVSPHLQNGTGSVDFIFLANYFIKLKRFALISNNSYKVNTTNKNGFRFANSLNIELRSTYIKEFKKVTWAPGVGVRFEGSGSDMENGAFYSLDTGGETLYLIAGMELYYKNVSLSAQYLQPMFRNLVGEQFKSIAGLQAGIKYSFAKKEKS